MICHFLVLRLAACSGLCALAAARMVTWLRVLQIGNSTWAFVLRHRSFTPSRDGAVQGDASTLLNECFVVTPFWTAGSFTNSMWVGPQDFAGYGMRSPGLQICFRVTPAGHFTPSLQLLQLWQFKLLAQEWLPARPSWNLQLQCPTLALLSFVSAFQSISRPKQEATNFACLICTADSGIFGLVDEATTFPLLRFLSGGAR